MKQLQVCNLPACLSQNLLSYHYFWLWDCPVRRKVTSGGDAGSQGEAGWFLQCPGLHGSARQNPAEDTRFPPPPSARGLSGEALPGGIVCELAADRRPRGAAPPRETRHASERANSRPPLAPSQQPPPATSSLPPWPRPPRRAPKSPAPWRRPLGPRRWLRGWDGTDVAHAWWRHQARELRRWGRRWGQPRAGPPRPGSWGWRHRRWRGLARPCGRRPTAAGGAVRRPGREPPGGHPRAGRAGPAERAAARRERPAAAWKPAAEAREPQSLPSGFAASRRGWRRGGRRGGQGHRGPRGGQHEPEGERRRPGGRARQPQGPEGPAGEAGGHVPPGPAAAAPRAAGAAPVWRQGRTAFARTRLRPARPWPGAPRALAVAGGRGRGEAGPRAAPPSPLAAPAPSNALGPRRQRLDHCALRPALPGGARRRSPAVESLRGPLDPHSAEHLPLAPAGFQGLRPRNGGTGLTTARNGCQSTRPNVWTFQGVVRTSSTRPPLPVLVLWGMNNAFWVGWICCSYFSPLKPLAIIPYMVNICFCKSVLLG